MTDTIAKGLWIQMGNERVSVLMELRSQWERQMCVQKNKIILERDMCWGGHRQNNLWGSGLLFSLRRFPRQSSGKKNTK